MEAFGRLPQGPAPALGAGLGRTRMVGRDLLRRRHTHGGCAAPRRSVRRPGGTSRLSSLCRARHGPPGLREGPRRPDGAFCCGRLSNTLPQGENEYLARNRRGSASGVLRWLRMDLGLKGKVAIVTGASRGIGRAIAEELANEGAHVSITARGETGLEAAAAELRRHGGTVVATVADVARAEDTGRVVEATLRAAGRIDILVNNAADIAVGRGVASSDDEWRGTLERNLLGPVRYTRAVVPHMQEAGGGRIVNVASIFGRCVPMAGSVDYNASKAALLSFSRTMAVELAPHGILVNSVCPGWIETPMLDRLLDDATAVLGAETSEQVAGAFQQYLLVKRMGRADEVAALVAFL